MTLQPIILENIVGKRKIAFHKKFSFNLTLILFLKRNFCVAPRIYLEVFYCREETLLSHCMAETLGCLV